MSTLEIANTILKQLGGSRFQAMTGAKDMLALTEGGLQMGLPRGAAINGINKVQILLDANDTYTVKAFRVNASKGLVEEKGVSEGVYNDCLQATFEALTGLATRL